MSRYETRFAAKLGGVPNGVGGTGDGGPRNAFGSSDALGGAFTRGFPSAMPNAPRPRKRPNNVGKNRALEGSKSARPPFATTTVRVAPPSPHGSVARIVYVPVALYVCSHDWTRLPP